jgi:hypothetical protein
LHERTDKGEIFLAGETGLTAPPAEPPRCVADPIRRRLGQILAAGPRTVNDVAARAAHPPP